MPNQGDLFPQNYGVTNDPTSRIGMDPMQFVDQAKTPWGGTPDNPLGNDPLISIFVGGINSGIDQLNAYIQQQFPDSPVRIPDLNSLSDMFQPCMGQNGLVDGFFNGASLGNLLFGGLTGIGAGSGTGLFGQSTLGTNLQTLLGNPNLGAASFNPTGAIPAGNVTSWLSGPNPLQDLSDTLWSDLGNMYQHFNDVVQYLLGISAPTTQQLPSDVATALQSTANTIVGLSSAVQEFNTVTNGQAQSGQGYSVNFGAYYNQGGPSTQPFTQAPFNTGYSGSGTGHLILNASGQAAWVGANNGDVSVVAQYITGIQVVVTNTSAFTLAYNGTSTTSIANGASASTVQAALQAITGMPVNNVTVTGAGTSGSPYVIVFKYWGQVTGSSNTTITAVAGQTFTDYQQLQATIAGLPNGAGSHNFACVRMSNDMQSYVYGAVYLSTGYQMVAEIGCYVSGVKTIFQQQVGVPINFSFTLLAGVGGNPNRFQGIDGNTVVFDYVDNTGSGGTPIARSGVGYRGWGFRSDTANGGQATPAPASYVGVSDNAPVATVGSGFRRYCSTSSNVIMPHTMFTFEYIGLGGVAFFDTIDQDDLNTSDWTLGFDALSDYAIPSIEGWYTLAIRIRLNGASAGTGQYTISAGYQITRGTTTLPVILVPGVGYVGNIASFPIQTTAFGGESMIYCKAGDIIRPGYYLDAPAAGGGSASAVNFTGDANGTTCWWGMVLSNRNLN